MGDIHCPVEATLGLIGGKYKALILWRLTDGTLRFSELQRIVTAATPKTLTTQLRELERDGLVARRVYARSAAQSGVFAHRARPQHPPGSGSHVRLGRRLSARIRR